MKKIVNARLALTAVGGIAALATYAFLIRPWHLRWGATDEEANMPSIRDRVLDDALTVCRRASFRS